MIDENLRQETKENPVNNRRNNKNSPVSLGCQNPRNVCNIDSYLIRTLWIQNEVPNVIHNQWQLTKPISRKYRR